MQIQGRYVTVLTIFVKKYFFLWESQLAQKTIEAWVETLAKAMLSGQLIADDTNAISIESVPK